MFRTQNLCPGSKNVFDSRQKHFSVVSKQQNLFPQHMFPARLNRAMFPSLARPLQRMWLWSLSNRAL